MAQEVGYFEDNIVYTEGPFVVTCVGSCSYRVEAEKKGGICTILPHISVNFHMKNRGTMLTCTTRENAHAQADYLNDLVSAGTIVNVDSEWQYQR